MKGEQSLFQLYNKTEDDLPCAYGCDHAFSPKQDELLGLFVRKSSSRLTYGRL